MDGLFRWDTHWDAAVLIFCSVTLFIPVTVTLLGVLRAKKGKYGVASHQYATEEDEHQHLFLSSCKLVSQYILFNLLTCCQVGEDNRVFSTLKPVDDVTERKA
ncbi:hypothetical protein F2Q69_00024142 [Brassica cretica]|uniref:Uncharacterized protein n=1 Tax=Brassica cretica TaxID=69181 RepID=A0A8S9Q7E2_BRACR|nr:hypothetical protein F2Q69_00024142 [Brassica cretica]